MSVGSEVWRWAVWLLPLLMGLGLGILGFSIARVLRIVKRARLADYPMLPEQTLTLDEAGTVVLCVQGTQRALMFRRFVFELFTPDGQEVRGWRNFFPNRTSGFTWVRIEARRFMIPEPGRYVLQARGMGDKAELVAQQRIVFMRPHLLKSIACVLGMLAGAGVFVPSLVFFILHFTGGGPGA